MRDLLTKQSMKENPYIARDTNVTIEENPQNARYTTVKIE